MDEFRALAAKIDDPEVLASQYLKKYYGKQIQYPVNPFKTLVDEGIMFSVRDFKRLEGVFIPASDEEDILVVGININRPITRQRFTAAHELCHFLRDAKRQSCPIDGRKSDIEKYADKFASGILMPTAELSKKVEERRKNGYVSFDDVLHIADYFGVSFQTCVFRIAYCIHAIQGDCDSKALRARIDTYKPDLQREQKGLRNNVALYDGLIDSYENTLKIIPNDFIRNVFRNEYIFNDSRLEGVDIEIERASEIVTDIIRKEGNSRHSSIQDEAFLSITGHTAMYSYIFDSPPQKDCSLFEAMILNSKLFSYYPYPEFGGSIRDSNTIVIGAKFETLDHTRILAEIGKLEQITKDLFLNRANIALSNFLKGIICLHHKLTVIHPFADGNGRTLRALFNLMMVRSNLTPVCIKIEDREEYLSALQVADRQQDYAPLVEFFYRVIIRTNAELTNT